MSLSGATRALGSSIIEGSHLEASVPIPKFASPCSASSCELRNQRDTSSLLKNPRQNESSLIQFFYHESVEARMRGAFTDQGQLFSYISPEARVRTDHPLRKIRELVRDVLGELNRSLSRLYG